MNPEKCLVNVWKERFPEKARPSSGIQNYNTIGKIKPLSTLLVLKMA